MAGQIDRDTELVKDVLANFDVKGLDINNVSTEGLMKNEVFVNHRVPNYVEIAARLIAKKESKRLGVTITSNQIKIAIFNAGIPSYLKSQNLPVNAGGWESLLRKSIEDLQD